MGARKSYRGLNSFIKSTDARITRPFEPHFSVFDTPHDLIHCDDIYRIQIQYLNFRTTGCRLCMPTAGPLTPTNVCPSTKPGSTTVCVTGMPWSQWTLIRLTPSRFMQLSLKHWFDVVVVMLPRR